MRDVVIVGAVRTPMGSFGGALKSMSAPQLGAIAIEGALSAAGVGVDQVDEVIMGCVLSAGMGQAPARQAAIGAGLPTSVPCTTINKVCGSGLKAAMMGAQAIQLGEAEIVVAGGMENMSQVPYALAKARDGFRMGHGQVTDLLIHDGLWDVYNDFHMGNAGEMCAREMEFSREAQDAFAAESYRRAKAAQESGAFDSEMIPVSVPQRRGEPVVVDTDEEPGRGKVEKFPALRPAFQKDGTITAANASTINDGAAAVILCSAEKADELGLSVLATWSSHAGHAQAPEWFTTAPIQAMHNALEKSGVSAEEVDLYEINEAFSVVTMAAMKEMNIPHEKVNVHGGAVSLGHPIGASGARLLVTLIHAMRLRDVHRGCTSLCIGGGEAVAVVVER